jgi:uncharacterized protein (TIGR02246 family)
MNTGSHSPGPPNGLYADEAAIARVTTALLNSINASDLTGVLAVWSDDGVMMPPHHSSVHGRTALEQYFRDLFSRTRFEFVFNSSRIEVSGDLAFERIEYTASAWPVEGGPVVRDVGKGLHVYHRQTDGTWKLAQDIWNSDTR